MNTVTDITEFTRLKLDKHRLDMQTLMAGARALIDAAVEECKYDFSKITRAKNLLILAEEHSKEIHRLEKRLHIENKKTS